MTSVALDDYLRLLQLREDMGRALGYTEAVGDMIRDPEGTAETLPGLLARLEQIAAEIDTLNARYGNETPPTDRH